MAYIDEIAERIAAHVDDPAPSADDLALYRIYAVLACAKGESVTRADVHDAWSAWTAERRPQHPALVPFDELSPEKQALDDPYVEAIRQVAHERAATFRGQAWHAVTVLVYAQPERVTDDVHAMLAQARQLGTVEACGIHSIRMQTPD